MRYLVLSDMHANLHALDAVLADAAAIGYDAVLVLGDLVGYGGDPTAVVERTLALNPVAIVRGNHDKVAAGLEPAALFNDVARRAIEWTAQTLPASMIRALVALPQGPIVVTSALEICHGAPFDEDVYIFDDLDAMRAFRAAQRPLCLFGHTHVAAAFQLRDREHAVNSIRARRIDLAGGDEIRLLVNCGAVGQPRDGDPRAAYGILDTSEHTLTLDRVEYDVAAAQAKILAAGLPDVLAQRLAVGR